MQVRHVVGLTLLVAAAVPLQLYFLKYNQDFRNVVSGIAKNLQADLLQLVAGYVDADGKFLILLNNLKLLLKLGILII